MTFIKKENECRVLSTTAILGYGYPLKSFYRGIKKNPHLIAVDAGSTDPGPYYLGSGKSFTNRAAVKRDLRYMIKEGVKRKIPVVIGSGGGSGARPHVDWCEAIIREIADEEKIGFSLGIIYADIEKTAVKKALVLKKIKPLACVPALKKEAVEQTTYIVAQMGMEPIISMLGKKCDVILCGRCYDPAVFAALPVMRGFDPGLCLHMGKILECASIAATPGSGSDCALGIVKEKSFILETLNPIRKFTKTSAAAHTLYEKSDPSHLPGPGGEINLENTVFRELPGGRVEISGSRFVPSRDYWIKLEGARPAGFRTISVSATRDPVMIREIDGIFKSVDRQVKSFLQKEKIRGSVQFLVYGKNGVMGEMEPVKKILSHELAIVINASGESQSAADSLCGLTRSSLLHYGYRGRISTAGNLAFPFSPSDAQMGQIYEFSIYHIMQISDQNIFRKTIKRMGKK
ncbi:MAG: 3-methylaspartate ammonia-lyase [Spirochaetes bacterium GWF1_41_5]|nr:MAG: 3-methylaspartate ammonia-lyase [Spirochaetes bacterium GWF1_41_5]HBE02516.1 3-methylaspartate ammonia-lyase [Spirochaetia bacterium]